MPSFSTSVVHRLGRDEAQKRLHSLMQRMRVEQAHMLQDMRSEWNENILTFAFRSMGMAIEGTMRVEEVEVITSGSLPLAAAFFRGKIEQTIRDEMAKALQS